MQLNLYLIADAMMEESKMVMPWGNHKGESIEDLPSSYLKWLAENCDNNLICEASAEEYRWRSDHQCIFDSPDAYSYRRIVSRNDSEL